MFLRLQYLPSEKSTAWRNASLVKHEAGRLLMEHMAEDLKKQNGWFAWRIVKEDS